MAMTQFDLSPFWRSTVGFDRLFEMLEEETGREHGYPPYNIERTGEDSYEVTLALAGFTPEDITITATQSLLTVEGRKTGDETRHYLHQGISARAFRRQFNLADYVEVAGAHFDNGLLRIQLVREIPEAMKPRRIDIQANGAPPKTVEHMSKAA
jgi:molecular chaperone IbpA